MKETNSTFSPPGAVSWTETIIYTGSPDQVNLLLAHKVFQPRGDGWAAFSMKSSDFVEDAHEADQVDPALSLLDGVRRHYAGYIAKPSSGRDFVKVRLETPPRIASLIEFAHQQFGNPLATGDFTEANGIPYGRLNLTQYLGNLYLSPDFYASPQSIPIRAEDGSAVLLAGVSPEPRRGLLAACYVKINDEDVHWFLGTVELEAGIVRDVIELPYGGELSTRLAWLDDHTFFAGGPVEDTGTFYCWSIVDLINQKEISSGLMFEDEPNFIIRDGDVWAERREAPQRVYPIAIPRNDDPIRIDLVADPTRPGFAGIRDGHLTVIIRNVSDRPVRILDPSSGDLQEDCLSFHMVHHDKQFSDTPQTTNRTVWGMPDGLVKNGHADYVELEPREEYAVDIFFYASFSPYHGEPLYLSVTYANMVGENCVQGVYTSLPMRLDFRDKGCFEIAGGGIMIDE